MTTRFNNWLLNLGILLLLGVAVTLFYAFFIRVTTVTPDPHRFDNPGNLLGNIIQVNILNATGKPGLALKMMEFMREEGFDVVGTDNYPEGILEKSVILDRIGNLDAAAQVALAIGLPASSVQVDVGPEYFFDATIVIGNDFEQIRPWRVIDFGDSLDVDMAVPDSIQ
ncbi:MAG: LytR C-terminal domain-containing protein [Bacteroidetes bacterium]|nr:LytR C-terminal domain-containing protein [Bacteroidota bacterium]